MNRLVRVLDWVVLAALTIALGWWLTTRSTGTDAAAGPVVQTVVLIAVILAVATLASATWRAARRSWTHVAAGSKLVWRRLDAHKSEQALALGLLGAAPAVDLPLLHDLAPNAPAAQTEHDTASTGVTSTSDRGDPSSPAAISPSAGKIAPGADDEAAGEPEAKPEADGETGEAGEAGEEGETDAAAAAANSKTSDDQQRAKPGETWPVQRGDSLWLIAETIVNDALGARANLGHVDTYWRELIAVNRSRLAPPYDPDLIFPGQTFVLPAPTWDLAE